MASASEQFGTTWPAKPHTLAKHAVLRGYLNAWFPILSTGYKHKNCEILYIDGFAGPGAYTGGEDGSPVIALKTALDHQHSFPKPVHFLFIEKEYDRIEHLKQLLEQIKKSGRSRNIGPIEVKRGECEVEINALLNDIERKGRSFGPALAFLDQFGFSGVPMTLVKRILSHDHCETFIYLDYEGINRFAPDATKTPGIDRAFGSSDWKACLGKEAELRKFYLKSLKTLGGAGYAYAFLMFDKNRTPLNWLVFCTGHWYGLQMMKKAMWAVDKTGNFRFSDKDDPSQLSLPVLDETYNDQWLVSNLYKKFETQTLAVAQLRDYVLCETPCYLFNEAFRILETERKAMKAINPPAGRKRGSFAEYEDLQFKFRKYEPEQVQEDLF
ncbi:MAG TPA: three-Cys-motif partner protein TcmP [Planctomycetota bacterium]|nr:three-Cys-motif partner protein TcmP [Planctomycetota bacterium]